MIHLILDTNIYRKSPQLNSPEFKALSMMAQKHFLCLHVPYVVEREFTTFLKQEQRENIYTPTKKIMRAMKYAGKGETTTKLFEQLNQLLTAKEEIIDERAKYFLVWMHENHGENYPLTLNQADKALEAYFNGQPPFTSIKHRDDIPDSFIYQAILELKIKYGNNLNVVTNDSKIKKACDGEKIKAYDSLSAFVRSDDSQEFLNHQFIEDNKPKILNHIHNIGSSHIEAIKNKVEDLLASDAYRNISGDKIPGENGEIFVSGVYPPDSIDFMNDFEYFGGGLFVVPFKAKGELMYEFPMSRSDWNDLDEVAEKKYSISPCNDHYFDAETIDKFQYGGRVEFDFGKDIRKINNIEEILTCMVEPSVEISELEDFEISA